MKALRFIAVFFTFIAVLATTLGVIGIYFGPKDQGVNIGAGMLLLAAPWIIGLTVILWISYYFGQKRRKRANGSHLR